MNTEFEPVDERNNQEKVTYTVSRGGVVTLYVEDRVYSVTEDHPSHREIIRKLKAKDFEGIEDMMCYKNVFERAWHAEIKNGEVLVNGVPLHNVLTKRTIELSRKGFPVNFLLKFLENCEKNPSNRAIVELYDFLENRNLPITEDGCFLAYKRVRENWLDIYSGTIENKVGTTVKMVRSAVDDERAHECARGLHVGAIEYVRNYGSGGHVLIVKVDPKNCISVPRDHNAQKLRVCEYEILYELAEEAPLPLPAYGPNGEKISSVKNWKLENDTGETQEEEEVDEHWLDGWDGEEEIALT